MQSVEADQVQLEHNAPQAAGAQQEPLHYASVTTSSDHDRRFQKVLISPVLWSVGQTVYSYVGYVALRIRSLRSHVKDLSGMSSCSTRLEATNHCLAVVCIFTEISQLTFCVCIMLYCC